MKHLISLISFLFLLFNLGKSQTNIVVLDSSSKQPLSYSTIYQFSSKSLFLCNNSGSIQLNILKQDSIRVSYAGYIDKVIKIETNKLNEIFLVRDIIILPEVLLKPCSEWSKSISYKPAADSGSFGGILWGHMGDIGRIAMFVGSQGSKRKLMSFEVELKSGIRGTKENAKAPIRFSFYSIDGLTMLPSDLLTTKTILFYPKRIGSQQINVDSLNLMIPEEGMYISLESYQDDRYSYLVPTKMPNGDVESFKMYGGALDGIYTKDSWLCFYSFKTAQWFFGGGKPLDKTRIHGALKYKIKYIVCNDKN